MRKVVQIATRAEGETSAAELYALCDDGSMWGMSDAGRKWQRIPNIPQDAPTLAAEGGGASGGTDDTPKTLAVAPEGGNGGVG